MTNPINSLLNEATQLQMRLQQIASLPASQQLALINETLVTEGPALENLQLRVQELSQNTQMFDSNAAIDISDTLSNCSVILRELSDNQEANELLLSQFDDNAWTGGDNSISLGNHNITNNSTNNNNTNSTQVLSSTLDRVLRQRERQAQDEEFKAAEFTDQNTGNTSLVGVPEQDFETLFPFFQALKVYVMNKESFVSTEAEATILALLEQTEAMLNDLCEGQATLEAEMDSNIEAQNNENSALQQFKETLTGSDSDLINQTFRDLSDDNKLSVLNALQDVLRENNTIKRERKLPVTWLNQPFSTWAGTPQDKLAAVESIHSSTPISNSTTTTTTTTTTESTTTTTTVEKKSEEMRRRMDEVTLSSFSGSSVIDSSPFVIETNSNSPISLMDFLEEEIYVCPLLAPLNGLQSILPHLEGEAAELNWDANLILATIQSQNQTCVFNITANDPLSIHERPYFHLYFIHLNSGQLMQSDANYGAKAFQGTEGFAATNSERKRAIQRTMVEITLAGLEEAIQFQDVSSLIALFDILQGISLDANDQVDGLENVAHNIFGAFYHLHVQAREANTSLVDPDSELFQANFGEMAFFLQGNEGIDSTLKLAAIAQVREALKRSWNV